MTYREIREAADRRFQSLSPQEYEEIAVLFRDDLALYAQGRKNNLTETYLAENEPYRAAVQRMRALNDGDRKDADIRAILYSEEDQPFDRILKRKRNKHLFTAFALLALHIVSVIMIFVSLIVFGERPYLFLISVFAAVGTDLFIVEFIRAGKYGRMLVRANTPKWAEKEYRLLLTRKVYERERVLRLPEEVRESTEYITPLERWEKEKSEIRKHPEKAWTLKTYDPGTGEPPTTEMLKAEGRRRYDAMTAEEYEKRALPIRTMYATDKRMIEKGYSNLSKAEHTAFSQNMYRMIFKQENLLDPPMSESTLKDFGLTLDDLRKGNRHLLQKKYLKLVIRLGSVLLAGGILFALALFLEAISPTVFKVIGAIGLLGVGSSLILLLKLLCAWAINAGNLNREVRKFSDPSFWEVEIETEVDRLIIKREKEILNY